MANVEGTLGALRVRGSTVSQTVILLLTCLSFVSEKAAPVDQDTHSPGSSSTQPLPAPNISHSKVLSESPAVSLSNSPCQSPMLREEDEHSETGESEGEDEDDVPGPQLTESDREVTEVDINDVDMNKVGCRFFVTHNAPGVSCDDLSCEGVLSLASCQVYAVKHLALK